jgi:tRNA pseudouridine38-40 synthase
MLGEKIETTGSGRTDTGVHALSQFAHFDYRKALNTRDLVYKLNSLLPEDIAVKLIRPVVEKAHARFDAIGRTYIYKITRQKDPFLINRAYYFRGNLDLDSMNTGAELLKTYSDFESFSKVKTEVNNFNCSISLAEWSDNGSELIFTISSDRFLRGMVRAIVGTLLDIGQGKLQTEELKSIIESKDRKKAGRAVPAHGLYLSKVIYPENIYLR